MAAAASSDRIAVLGAGVMGTGIAQVFAQFGFAVAQTDVSEAVLTRATTAMRRNLEGLAAKGKLAAEEVERTLGRIRQTTVLEDAAGDATFVVEAVLEDLETKKRVFAELDRACAPGTVLASNTSILSPTEIAAATKRPDRCIGMHFMNPAPIMRLVELVPGLLTSEATVEATRAMAGRIGKTAVVAREAPGGIVSRIMMAMRNEAVDILADGVATAEEIDTAMRLGAGFPIGPLALIDLVGVDLHVTNSDSMVRETGNPKYRPHPLLRKMVRAGLLGRKSGRGFYRYEQ
ncbi:MAG: 3-hydroxybutyryl-CoA dehydrogenase [Candidatus Rokubacteria bacterium]|nr:3-hydroxybutyryl-CoA dehydrogenase [Candidatus Rokubacteria bacterium]